MPGTDARETARMVLETLDTLPFLPELPARGPGADMIGRTLGLLVELYAQVEPSGWRFADRPGRDSRRAVSWLGADLDALEEFTQGYAGPLKLQVTGPWTLAASVELRGGESALTDPGACRDLAASLTEGLHRHIAGVRRRIPQARLVVQLDEPSLPAVLGGQVPTASGYRTYRSVDQTVAEGALRDLIAAVDAPVVVHCCAAEVPLALLRRSGADAVSMNTDLITESDYDEVGEAIEDGFVLFAGVVPTTEGRLSDPGGSVRGVRTLWRRLGLDPGRLAQAVVITPSCGLAYASPGFARAALAHCVRAARTLVDDPE